MSESFAKEFREKGKRRWFSGEEDYIRNAESSAKLK
jgi:hypothetical protein